MTVLTSRTILTGRAPPSREKRLDTLSAFFGDAKTLLQELEKSNVDQRIRTFSQSGRDDLVVALEVLGTLRDIGLVIHGPRGCAAALFARLRTEAVPPPWITTDLTQRETILGADRKLQAAIAALHRRHRPAAIVVVTTPAIAINNDDVISVVNEFADEHGTTVIPLFASGFASKAGVHGVDLALASLVEQLVRAPADAPGRHVNLLSIVDPPADRRELGRLLNALGLEVHAFPAAAGIEAFGQATTARASLAADVDQAIVLGEVLEAIAGVPFVAAPRPIGLGGTERWLAAIGAALELDDEARRLHAAEAADLSGLLQARPLAGARVYLGLAPATAFAVTDLVRELGGTVVGLTLDHVDRLHLDGLRALAERTPDLIVHVGDGQAFEEINILGRDTVDLYVGAGPHIAQIARLGRACLSLRDVPIAGYAGVAAFARRATRALRNRAFVEVLAASPLPYAPNWLRRSPNWHIKQEVR